jgi:alpha-1,6-mannosyltransferase
VRVASHASLWVVVAGTSAVLVRGRDGAPGWNLALLAVAFVAFAALLVLEDRRPALSVAHVVVPAFALLLLAVVVAPVSSRDVWSYVAYGRTVSVHHESPYVSPPAEFPDDPMYPRVSRMWRDTPSVYGPLFTAVSAGGMAVTRASATASRMFFQALAALAVVGAIWLVWRETRDHRAVALVSLNPFVVVAVVNGGHNDALVGFLVVGAVLLAVRDRPWVAGGVLGAAALVKITALLPLAAVVAWALWRPSGWRRAGATLAAGALVVVVGYALAGGRAALEPLSEARLHTSAASPWDEPRADLTRARIADGERGLIAGREVREDISRFAGLAVAVVAVAVVVRRRREATPAVVVGGAVLSYLLLGAYVLPWYAAWALFPLALRRHDHLTVLALAHAALLELAYVPRPDGAVGTSLAAPIHDALVHAQDVLRNDALPVVQVLAVVALVGLASRRNAATVATTRR